MKQLPHVSALLYGQPWNILPASHSELGRLYQSYLAGTLPAPQAIAPESATESGIYCRADHGKGIAVLYLSGIILKNAPDMLCAPACIALSQLDGMLEELGADAAIHTIVLYFNSPGGQSIGLMETCANLRELSAAGKRVVCYADEMLCSAAYWLACACDEIYAAPSAMIASIGTYCAGIDDSRAWEMEGMELILAKSGNLKAMGHPGKAWTPEEKKWLQAMVDKNGAEFRTWVTSRRANVPEDAMQGQWIFAKDAPPALTDGLYRDLPALLADLMEKAAV